MWKILKNTNPKSGVDERGVWGVLVFKRSHFMAKKVEELMKCNFSRES